MIVPRMKHPVMVLPEAFAAMRALGATAEKGGVPKATLLMIALRASQINGCSFCVDMHAREMREAGESEERMASVAAWRHAPYFTDAERAALALTEALTRIADQPDPVSDGIWQAATAQFDEKALAGLLFAIGAINVWNRINVAVGTPAGPWKG